MQNNIATQTKDICSSCKKNIDIDDNYCRYCGYNLKENTDSINVPQDDLSTVINCVENLPFEAGLNYVTKILKGSKSILKNGNQESDFYNYGALTASTINKIKIYIDYLVDEGVLDVYESGNFGNIKVKIGDLNLINDKTRVFIEHKNKGIHKKKKQDKAIQAGEPWSDLLDQELEFLHAKQLSMEELKEHFGRSIGGIRARLKRLGLLD